MRKLILIILVVLISASGCIRFIPSSDYNESISSNNTPAVPLIFSFTASPGSIRSGEHSTLNWSVLGATSVFIDQGIGTVALKGTQAVSPGTTTTYTLTATNSAGSVTRKVQVNVRTSQPEDSLPVINSFTANPGSVIPGEISTLSWNVSNATAVSLDHAIGSVALMGTRDVNPVVTTMYTLTATNAAGNLTATATVMILAGPLAGLPSINSFLASPSSIAPGGSSTLAWNVTDATTITIDNGIGTVPLAIGLTSVNPPTTTTYTLTAVNAAGSVSASAIVIVQAAPPAVSLPTINSFNAAPDTIAAGGSTTLSWNVSDATTVTIDNGIGTVAATGSSVVSPAANISYTLLATNAVGWRSLTIPVIVTSGGDGGGGGVPPPAAIASLEQALFNEVNAIRVTNGLAPLVRDSYMDGLAREHSVYMANLHTLSHDNFLSVRSPAIVAYFGPCSTGENVLNRCPVDYGNAQPMAQQWYDSPPHRANMLDGSFTRTGMGIAIINEGGMECAYATQLFAGVP
ncbi:CAP domain-containing protein [Chloroflexota bacterium]